MRHPLPRRLVALALAGAVVGLAACGDDDGDAPQAELEVSGPEATGADGTDETEREADRPDVIGVTFPDPDDVVAEATFPAPHHEGEEIRIGIESVVVTDQTMELRLVVTPLFDDDGDPLSVYDLLDNGTGVNPATLIDRVHLKEYRVLRDGSHRYETDPQLAEARAGESVGFQKFFAPPEDDIDVIDVKIHDDLPVFEDVPLTFEG